MNLDKRDYETIIKYYNVKLPRRKKNNLKTLRQKSHRILINKLCRCIEAVQKAKTKKKYGRKFPIAVCNKSIFGNRNIKHFRFTCKKKKKLYPKKGTRKILVKTAKIHFNKKRKRISRRRRRNLK